MYKRQVPVPHTNFIVHLLQDSRIRYLYQTRMSQFAQQTPITDNVNQEWGNVKATISDTALEALERTRKR